MSRKDVRLKDNAGNYLFPLAHKDDDGNIIKQTYVKNIFSGQIVSKVIPLYAKNDDIETPPDDGEFYESLPVSVTGAYLWQCMQITYLNGNVELSVKVNLTSMLAQ